ncbi:receptor protein kinase [Beggiatoa sp. PS]|nr:receptor protein kinase [Beggiatoa sp. PS]
MDGIDLYVNFDAATLQVNSITNNSMLDFAMKNKINTGNFNFSAVNFANASPSGDFDFITLNITPLAASAGTALQFDTNNSTVTYNGSYLNYTADDLTVAIDQSCGFSCNDVTEIPTAQCETLVALYDSTDGDNWTNNTGWKQTNTPCSWYGVACLNGGISVINLLDNNLIGTLPDLSNLTNLQYLWLQTNQLSGTIPDLSQLTQLQSLILHSNQFTGTIPDLSASSNLQQLELQLNQLSGTIPTWISTLTQLENIQFNKNQLTGSIPNLSALTQLQVLNLNKNQLSGSIPELSALTQLSHFSANTNQLTGEIPNVNTLSNLGHLALNDNQLTGNVPDLSGLTSIQLLWLHNNQLEGPIPALTALTNLDELNLSDNSLCQDSNTDYAGRSEVDAFPTCSICDTAVQMQKNQCETLFALYDNTNGDNWSRKTGWKQTNTPCGWEGIICNSDGYVTNISLYNNQLVGTLPDLSVLTELLYVSLSGNQLTGSLPDLSASTKLHTLAADNNQLSGTLPDLSALTQLKTLYFHDNQFTGSVPNLSALTNLEELRLHTNQLTGSIPELSALTKLQFLSFGNNKLTGTIPELSALTKLQDLRLYSNQLTGSIPDLSALTQLQFLSLGDNQLTGTMPDLSALTNLQELRLYDNQLTGSIPDELSNLTQLEILRLEDNQFTGTIPDLSALTLLTDLRLSKNQLTGSIPDVSGAENLQYFYLQYNDLSGEMPSWINTLTDLERLYLNDNDFTGPIPDLSALTNVQYLTVSVNPLCKNSDTDYGDLDVSAFLDCDDANYGLVLHLPFEGNANDTSGNGNDGSLQGDTTFVEDGNGQAALFDGDGDYILVADSDSLDVENITISMLIKANQLNNEIFTNNGPPSLIFKKYAYLFRVLQSRLDHDFFDGTNWDAGPGWGPSGQREIDHNVQNPLELEQWNFVAMTFDGNTTKYFVNDELVETVEYAVNIAETDNDLQIGWSGHQRYWDGLIDEVRVHNRPLSDNEVQNLYNATKPATTGCNGDIQLADNLCEGLIAYYPLDGNPNDVSGNGNNGLEKGGVDYLAGQQAQAAHFDGVDNTIEIPDSSNLHFGTDSLSVSMWLNANTFAGKDRADEGIRFLSKNGYPDTWWVTDILPNGQIQLAMKDSDGVRILDKKSTTTTTTEQWYHLAMVIDRANSELRYYLNGTLDATHALSAFGDISIKGHALEIGSAIFNPFNGLIDELYLHRRVLTDAEIQKLYGLETLSVCNGVTEIPTAQCETLVALYDSTGGDNWTNNDGWLQNNTPCTGWYNLACKNGHVTDIALENNNLVGTIPDISALTELETLVLGKNPGLTGNFPDISQLSKLYHFSVGPSQISGTLPATLLNASQLRELSITESELSGDLPDFSQLTHLTQLNLGQNQFTGKIPALPSGLTLLNLAGNELCQNPNADYAGKTEVDAFEDCEFLDLFWLDSTAPEEPAETTGNFVLENGVSYLVQVKGSISVWSPDWETDGYCGTPEDSPLYPSSNKQNGSVGLDYEYGFAGPSDEAWICGGNMPSDRSDSRMSVDGGNTWFTPTPLDSAYNPEHVYTYQVTGQGNALQVQFTDPSPSDNYGRFEIQVLPTPTVCSTVTEIPTAQCETLVALYDSTNGDNWTNNTDWLQNNTPCSWQGITCGNGVVTEIKLLDNNLIGTLPDLSALTGLEHLALYSAVDEEKKSLTPNQLTGNIPDLSALTNLKVLHLVGNQLDGPIPDMSALTQLQFLALGFNKLSGQIPEFVSTLTNLTMLHLPTNQLTGTIPDLSALTKLQAISLHRNQLTGPIPELKEQTQLRILTLSANKFSGTIPESISTLTNLTGLYLAANQLTGTIPDLSALTKLEYIHLHLNQFTGQFPDVSGAGNLQDISVADNSLSGELPSWLNTLTNLEWLHLHDNSFTGEIPELSQLSQLQILSLQDNQLTGPIPDLAQFSDLETLTLTNNQFCQSIKADYGNWAEVNEFPSCADVNLIAEASTASACIGQNLTITVNKQLAQTVNEIQMALSYDANLFKINSITNAGPLTEFNANHANGTAQITAGNFTGVSDDFAIATLQLTPLATSVGTTVQFNDSQTTVKLSGTTLRYESQGTTIAIKDCVSDIVIQPNDNSAIWTLVEEAAAIEQTGANLNSPKSMSFDASGNAYIADSLNHRILKRDTQGNLTVVAGTGAKGSTGDDGPAIEAKLKNPQGTAIDHEGNLYIADTLNHRIRKVDSNGIITTVAGIGKAGNTGDNGLATAAKLRNPTAIVFDNNGHLYIADSGNHRIRKVSGQRTRKPSANSIITTVAGNGRSGYQGDNGPATGARLSNPTGLAVDSQNNLYIADTDNHRIRKVDLTGTITTVAGNGNKGYSGDGDPATAAQINTPTGLEVDSTGNLYIADKNNHRIRKVDTEGIITTFTGTGKPGTATDGIIASVAQISQPTDVALDQYGNLYIADKGNDTIRKIGEKDGEDGAAPPHQIADCPNTEVTGISENECYALIALYDSTNGPDWTNNTGWKATDTPCQWPGVTCANGTVTAIDLPNNNLVGDIPDQIGALINLEELNLNDNQISGAIPTTIDHLNNLETLNVENNALTGSLPVELGDATNLQTVNLANNQISGEIPDLNALTQLETLDLSENLLNGSVPDLTELTALQTLEISGDNQQLCRDSDTDYGNMPVGNLDECPTGNQLPTAAFTATPNKGEAPLTVNLNASDSSDQFGYITAYFWETSDGQVLTGSMTSITFQKSGMYEITLKVMDNDGAPSINVAKHLVEVYPGPNQATLSVDKDGMGLGSVRLQRDKDPATTCKAECQTDSQDYPQGSEIKLTASAAKGSLFTGWRGDCVGTEEDRKIKVTMDSAKQCTAVFELEATPPPTMHALTIDIYVDPLNDILGSGGTLEVKDIVCENPPCMSYHQADKPVKITGTPIPHAYFKYWNPDCPIVAEVTDATNLVVLPQDATCVAFFGNDSVPASENMAKDFEQEGELSTGESVAEIYPEVDNRERYELAFLVAEKAMMTAETQMIIPGEQSWPDQFDEVEDFFKLPDNLWVKKVRIVSSEEQIGNFHVEGQYVRVDVLLLNKYGHEDLVPILIYYQDKPTLEETAPPPMEGNNTRRGVRGGGCWWCRPIFFPRKKKRHH